MYSRVRFRRRPIERPELTSMSGHFWELRARQGIKSQKSLGIGS